MTITAPQIECYLYAETLHLSRIQLTDSGGGPVSLDLAATATVSDALADWAAQANANATLNSTAYDFYYDPASGTIVFDCDESFDLGLRGSLPEALGFSSSSLSGSLSYSSDLTPLTVCNPVGIDYETPHAAEETELVQYRWGRISSRVHYRAKIAKIQVLMRTSEANDLLDGPILCSRAVYYPYGYTSGAYSKTNLRGYLDVYPYTWTETDQRGAEDVDTIVTVVGALEGS